MSMVVGNTYTIELDGGTATQGYNQFEDFINFPNTIFQILSVSTTYSADSNTTNVPNPNAGLYANACIWDNDPNSPNYRSCVGGDDKAGGSTVATTYTVKIITGGGTSQTLNTLLYDFSGSSFHYNSDFSSSSRIATITDPTSVTISKSFSPGSTTAGGNSTLIFTITNPTSTTITGVNFTDSLPILSASQMVVASPATYSTSGCGSPTFAPTAGAASLTFGTPTGATLAPNGTCTVSVNVTVPSGTTGTYHNVSNDVFVNTLDTGHSASADLAVTAASSNACLPGLTMAEWTVPNGTTANPPDLTGGLPTVKASDVSTATASASVPADTSIATTLGQGDLTSWQTWGYKNSGQHINFVIDTSKYTGVSMAFYVDNPSPSNGPTSLVVSYNNGSGSTNILTISNPASSFTQHTIDFSGLTSTTGSTTFTITGSGANNDQSSGGINFDNIAFTGCGALAQPTLSKAFSPNPILVGGTSTLTFTLFNPNTATLHGLQFTDSLPSGLTVATGGPTPTCGGSLTTTSPGSISFSGGTLTGGASCTIPVTVTATTAGPHTNISGFLSSTEGGTNSGSGGSATASLTALQPPTISKIFDPNPILTNGTSTLTFLITNPNTNDSLPNVAFADTFPTSPAAMVIAASPNATRTGCGSPTYSPIAGAGSITFSNGTIAASATCTVTVDITAPTAGSYANTSGAVTTTISGVTTGADTASDSLTVNAPHPSISLLKEISSSSSGPWSKFISIAPTTNVYYRFTIENTGDVPLSPVSVSDPTVSTASCTWPATLPVASPTQDPTATCVVGVVGAITAQSGDNPNTATAHGTYSSTDYTATSSADYFGAIPGFSILKQVSASPSGPWSSAITDIAPGSNVYYKFTIVNTGNVALSSVNVTDPDISTTTCTFPDPFPANSATTCIVGPVSASSTAGTHTNTATARNSTNSGAPSSSADYTVTVQADLSITKTDSSTTYTPGSPITYTIIASNSGPSDVTGASVSDTLPASITGATWTCTSVASASCTASGSGNINDTAVNLPSGTSVTYILTGTVSASASGSLSNTAVVSAPSGVTDPTPGNNSATDTDTSTALADLSITKTDSSTTYTPGDPITYTIVASNNGPLDVTNASVSDTIPASITGATWTCLASDVTASCTTSGSSNINDTAVNLPNGTSVTYILTGTVSTSASGSLSNTAIVSTPSGITDPTPLNNSVTDTDTSTASADLSVTKSDSSTTYTPGSPISYTIIASNSGPSDVTGASVSDTIPASIIGATWTCTPSNVSASCTASGSGSINDTAVNLPSTTFVTYTLTGTVSAFASGSLSNTAVVSAPSGITDSTPSNNSATDTDTSPSADLSVTKTDSSTTYTPGSPITYTIVASNSGPSDVTGATLADTLPAGITGVTWTCTPGASASCTASGSGSINDTAVNLPSTTFVTYTLTGTVSASASGSLSNTATISTPSGVTDPTPGNNSATDTDTEIQFIDPTLTKSVNPAQAAVGDTMTFTIVVSNKGTVAATNVVVTDVLPNNLDYTSASSAPTGNVVLTPPRTLTETIATLNPSDVITITIVTTVNGLGTPPIQNTASLTADPPARGVGGDPTANDSAAVTLVITSSGSGSSGTSGSGGLAARRLPSTGFAPGITTLLPPQPSDKAYSTEGDIWLEIPRLDLHMPIVGVPFSNGTWDVSWISNQAGWLQGTAFPTWSGNSVLTGHVYLSNGLPGPFVNLHTLQWGDLIIVHLTGQRYIYQVRTDEVVSPDDTSVFKHEKDPWLTLITCKDYAATTNTYTHRVAVTAVLVTIETDSTSSQRAGVR